MNGIDASIARAGRRGHSSERRGGIMQSQIPLWLEWLRKLPLERMIREGFEEETTILQYVFVAERSQNAVSKPLLLDVDRISRIISAFVIGFQLYILSS